VRGVGGWLCQAAFKTFDPQTQPPNSPTLPNHPNPSQTTPTPAPQTDHIVRTQSGTLNYWGAHGADLLKDGVTLDGLKAALVTVSCGRMGRGWGFQGTVEAGSVARERA
jgi:hypothetical protein